MNNMSVEATIKYISYRDYCAQKTMSKKELADAFKTAINSVYGSPKVKALCSIKRVIFNDPATIILWADGTKTVVKCAKDETFDPEKGLAMAIAKKALGNEGWYYDIFKAYLPKDGGEK